MLTIKILSIIAFLPSLYPLFKIHKRLDLNLFDFILLFHGVHFCIIPLIKSKEVFDLFFISDYNNDSTAWNLFIYYVLFSITIFIIDFYWSKKYANKYSLINITLSIKKQIEALPKNRFASFLSNFVVIGGFVFLLPNRSAIFRNLTIDDVKSYEESSFMMIFNIIFSIFFIWNLLYLFKYHKKLKMIYIYYVRIVLFFVVSFFMGRFLFFSFILFAVLIYYSCYKNIIKFNLKVLTIGIITYYIIFVFLFPFFNVLRYSSYMFENREINAYNLIGIENLASASLENYNVMIKDSERSTDARPLGVYVAIHKYIEHGTSPLMGKAVASALSYSVPHLIFPNKSLVGSQAIVEVASGHNKDLSDSLLLMNYADWHIFGFITTILCYLFLFFIVVFLNKTFHRIFVNEFISISYTILLFYLCISTEQTFEGELAKLIQFSGVIVVLSIILKIDKLLTSYKTK